MNNLPFDFTVDKETKTITVVRAFAAELAMVWDAFTKPEILDQWWAPKPFESKTKVMHFEVGGRRFYGMVGPENQESWAVQKYSSITPKTNFKFFNAFADKEENLQLPGSDWDLNFSEQNGITTVNITIYNESFDRMEQLLDAFKQGFTATLDQLENLLPTIQK